MYDFSPHQPTFLQISIAHKVRVFTLILGFSLAYGSLFAKVWIAHKLMEAQKNIRIGTVPGLGNEVASYSY